MSLHSFDPNIAKTVGVNAAVLYQNIVWWCEKNAANGRHCHDGRYWTYNSVAAWCDLFPYLTANQIRTALEKLLEAGLILTGYFSEVSYDRTKWYCPSTQIHLGKTPNGNVKNHKSITDIKPDIKEDTKVSSKNKRGSRLKDDWFLPADWGEWAVSEGWPVEVVRDQAERFKDYWCAAPGQKGVKLDWQATWRNWMRNSNAKKMGYANGKRNHSNKTDPALEQIARLAGLSQTPGDGGR